MYDKQGYPPEHTSDPLDEFLAQLLSDTPDVLPAAATPSAPTSVSVSAAAAAAATFPTFSPIPGPTSSLPFPSSSTPTPANVPTATTPYYTATSPPGPYLTCEWVTTHGLHLVCGAPLSPDPKSACNHFRRVHNVRGNEKVTVQCNWRDCPVAPMQRGSLIRHILTIHLGLLKWQCEACGKMFSRKGTAHACVQDD